MTRPTTCDDCGVCCLYVGPGFLQNPEKLEDANPEPCEWYDPAIKGCSNYDDRPQPCHGYERGDESCMMRRAARGIV